MQIPRAVPVSAFGRPAAQELHPGQTVAGGCNPYRGGHCCGAAQRAPLLILIL